MGKHLHGQDIICLSTQDWDDMWTRKHRFMLKFAQRGNRVLYVEQQMHWLGYFKYLKSQWRRLYLWLLGPRPVRENLYLYTLPPVVPFFLVFPFLNRIKNFLVAPLLRQQSRKLGFNRPILWSYGPSNGDLVGRLGEKAVVYECVDDYPSYKGLLKRQVVAHLEDELLWKADVVIVTAASLYADRKDRAKRIHLIPNGAEVDHFESVMNTETQVSSLVAQIPHPIVGFLGGIANWIDVDLIRHIACARPHWSVVLVGPVTVGNSIRKIKSLPNIHLLGRQPYDSLPGILKAFDVCINPFILDDLAKGVSPLKFYEYLATGKPIVSTDMPEVSQFGELVRIAHSPDEFVFAIESALSENDSALAQRRRSEAHKHSWDSRFAQVEQAVLHDLGALVLPQ